MERGNELESYVKNLVDTKVLNLDVTLSSMIKGGAISGIDPWDIWCGNGWIVRRWPGPRAITLSELDNIRNIVQQEMRINMKAKG